MQHQVMKGFFAHWRKAESAGGKATIFLFLSFVLRGQCTGFTFPAIHILTFGLGKGRVAWSELVQGKSGEGAGEAWRSGVGKQFLGS